MKYFALVLAAAIALSYAKPAPDADVEVYGENELVIRSNGSENTVDEFLDALERFALEADVTGIVNIEMNSVCEELLQSLRSYLIHSAQDPMQLEDRNFKLGLGILGSIRLYNGWLLDLSMIQRSDDVIVSYNSNTRRLVFTIPVTYEDLMFTYQYKTRVTLLTIHGDVQGKIENVHMNVQIMFDYDTRRFFLQKVDMRDSGRVTVEFTGHGLVDWIVDAMSNVITTLLHPLLVSALESRYSNILQHIVRAATQFLEDRMCTTTPAAYE